MQYLHLILFVILMAASVALAISAIIDFNEADRIEKETNDE